MTSNSDADRKAFETHYIKWYPSFKPDGLFKKVDDVEAECHDEYILERVQETWEAWKACQAHTREEVIKQCANYILGVIIDFSPKTISELSPSDIVKTTMEQLSVALTKMDEQIKSNHEFLAKIK